MSVCGNGIFFCATCSRCVRRVDFVFLWVCWMIFASKMMISCAFGLFSISVKSMWISFTRFLPQHLKGVWRVLGCSVCLFFCMGSLLGSGHGALMLSWWLLAMYASLQICAVSLCVLLFLLMMFCRMGIRLLMCVVWVSISGILAILLMRFCMYLP